MDAGVGGCFEEPLGAGLLNKSFTAGDIVTSRYGGFHRKNRVGHLVNGEIVHVKSQNLTCPVSRALTGQDGKNSKIFADFL